MLDDRCGVFIFTIPYPLSKGKQYDSVWQRLYAETLHRSVDMLEEEKPIEIPGKWEIPYKYSAGRVASKFFRELKENRRIMGTKCPKCGRVFLPPRYICEDDFVELNEWVEVSDIGTVQTFTITYQPFMGFPNPPYVIALIKLDGASTSIAHFIGEVDLSDLNKALEQIKIGMRVKAVFRDERVGSILDIKYFKPV